MKEKKDRVDDALAATRAAVEEGIVPGGGVAIVRATEKLGKLKEDNDDEQTGINIVTRAAEEPLRQIVENAGLEGSVIVAKVREGKKDFGFNAKTEVFENLYKAGVIDPAKVVRVDKNKNFIAFEFVQDENFKKFSLAFYDEMRNKGMI